MACYSQTAKDKFIKNNPIKFETETTNSSLRNYSDACILVTRDITVVNAGNDTDIAF